MRRVLPMKNFAAVHVKSLSSCKAGLKQDGVGYLQALYFCLRARVLARVHSPTGEARPCMQRPCLQLNRVSVAPVRACAQGARAG